MKKKLLYVAEVGLPGRKASSIHVMRMCEAFAEQGLQVRLLAFRSPGFQSKTELYMYYGIKGTFELKVMKSIGTGRLASFLMGLKALWYVIVFRPDIAYSRSPVSSFFMSWAAREIVFEAHSFIYQAVHKWHLAFFKRFVRLKSFLGLVVISGALKSMYTGKGVDDDVILVAHDGADQKPLDETGELKGGFAFNAGYFGSVFRGRGIEVIFQMALQNADAGFHIFGGEAKDVLWTGQWPRNLFFYGFVSPATVHRYRNACDVLLAPYQPEVFVSDKHAYSTSTYMSPLKIFEYMSARKAIIVSDMPVLREVLSEQVAMMVSPGEPGKWTEAIQTLMTDTKRKEEMAENAFRQFKKYHTWNQRAGSIVHWLMARLK